MYQPSQQVLYQGAIATIVDTLPSVIGYDYLIRCGNRVERPVTHDELTEIEV
jgi:hypothetical protein